jgi:5'(3')-deoxyribonucleotidase
MKIYVDMDGVLAAYHKRWGELYGVVPLNQMRTDSKLFYKHWDDFVDGRNFETLERLSGFDALMDAVKSTGLKYEILSSSGSGHNHEKVVEQKMKWLHKNHFNCPINIVRGGAKKAEFAKKWNVLIDDTPHVVETYRKAGGTAILHEDATVHKTIEKLKALHETYNREKRNHFQESSH